MSEHAIDSPEALAQVLILAVVADTEFDARELAILDELDAYARLGTTREAFLRQALAHAQSTRLGERGYLRMSDIAQIDAALEAVRDPAKRLLVCRLAASVITADGRVHDVERLVFDHMLCRWGLTRSMVSRAMLADRWPATA
ncbi:hypothetical protein [Azohydromonas sediminis]|uniref:hypothetical protein n=1 Tax=Azohydromonas sediminis TaxID=2259674 RepID=UPI000E647C54|nr:hypothetical protein [Azohydromonas sediminis]